MATAYSLNGSGNNVRRPTLNAKDTSFTQTMPENLGPNGRIRGGPNAREISNEVVGLKPAQAREPELSGFMYAYGQFTDHDMDLSKPSGTRIDIPVPDDDPILPPDSVIPLTRFVRDSNGLALNQVTGWLDGSQIYGSDATTAAFLRGEGGRLRESKPGELPVDEAGVVQAGDVRAAENPNLTAVHTLMMREHNYQVEQLAAAHPNWSDDELYFTARSIVTAEHQNIVLYEFLPHLLGPDAIDAYEGYDPTIDPRPSEEFAGAAFRFGHTLVSGEIQGIDNNGKVTSEHNLADVFFRNVGDVDGLLRQLSGDPAQKADAQIIHELRNLLVDPPNRIDLAATNIQRGRDLGLPTLNGAREALGLDPYTKFSQISDDPATNKALAEVYASPNDIDLWPGGLAEEDVPDGILGPVFTNIIADEFTRIRGGDALWFENDQFDDATLEAIRDTTLGDIIARNTDTEGLQTDPFVAAERQIADGGSDAELIVARKGDPKVNAGGGDDTIVAAGVKKVTVTGGPGKDLFQFPTTGSKVAIADFTRGHDQLQFGPDVKGRGDVTTRRHGDDLIVKAGGNTVTLDGISAISASDIRFVSGIDHASLRPTTLP